MLRLFGPTRVSGESGPRLPRAAFLAIALLDLAPSRVMTREALAARLWEGAPSARANASLRQLVSRIRSWEEGTGRSVLKVTPFTVGRDETTLSSDLSEFLALGPIDTAATLRLVAELYGGDFLADIEGGSEGTGQWITQQRTWLRDRFVKLALAGAQQVGGEVAQSVLRRLADESPYDDAIVRAGMVAARHDPVEVRAIYDTFARRLADDLGNAPEARTETLLRELTNDAPVSARLHLDEPSPAMAASVASVPRVLILPPADGPVKIEDRKLGEILIDEVTHTLGRLRTFAVFAPHTARALANSPFPAGNPYGADYLVTTRLTPGLPDARLCIALTRVETHELLLSEELRFTPDDLNAHHFHLAAAIGTRLASGIERSEQRIYRTTGSASAYVHYLLGCEDLRSVDLRIIRRARGHFRQSLKLSRDFAPARAMMARAISIEWLLLDRNERERIEKAIEFAREATRLDPLDPNGHREVGHALIYAGAIDEAVESLRSAAHLGPHSADVLFQYGDGLVHLGEIDEARRVLGKALNLNPLAPDLYYWVTGTADYLLGNYSAASEMVNRMKNREPASRFIAAVEAMNGNLEAAARHRDIYLAQHPGFKLADYLFPLKRENREHYFEGLRRAGFV
jgi:DNA-binding SARP family transcriptional activator/tetratricopeptide (TPR) repeat protein